MKVPLFIIVWTILKTSEINAQMNWRPHLPKKMKLNQKQCQVQKNTEDSPGQEPESR